MNKRGAAGDNQLTWYIAYFIFAISFFSIMLFWVVGFQDGGALLEDFYAKQISRLLNNAKPGDLIKIDVSPATKIGIKNRVEKNDMFRIDSENNIVIVKLSKNSGTSFKFFNEINVSDVQLILPSKKGQSGDVNINQLSIKIGGYKNES